MATTRKETEKRHNPVESICRKIRAIQKREVTSNPIRQIIRYQASGSQSPRAHSKKNLGDLLKIGMAAHFPVPASPFSSSEQVGAFISCPKVVSPRTPHLSPLGSPGNGTCPVTLTSSENASRLRSSSKQSGTPLLSRSRQGMLLNEGLDTCCSENCRTFTLDFDSASGQSYDSVTPQESVVKQLSLNEDEWKLGGDDGKDDVTPSTHGAPGDEPLAGIFHAWGTTCREGSGGVGRILDNLRHTGPESEDGGLEELRSVLDPENGGPSVGLETLQATVREWVAHCRSEREGETSRLSSVVDDSVFEPWDSMKSVKMTTDGVDSTPGSLEGAGGASHQQVLEVSDLLTYVAHLHFNKQKLEEENRKFKLAMETLEEANSQLLEDCAELRLQIKSAQQAVMRTNLLKEELEELKMSMSILEKQKTTIGAQNKQLETENRALVLKIRMLQEENIRNIIDTDRLEKKIEELTKIDTEHQMQLRTYENTLLTKDASIRKKDLRIEELKSTIIDYGSVIEVYHNYVTSCKVRLLSVNYPL
nr:inositol 1,4,5-triphosphate receptor associated 2 [Oryctolagus cuniculus]